MSDKDRFIRESDGATATNDDEEACGDVTFSWKRLLNYSGPGCLIAIAYLDPGNLEADLQAGSYTKYQLGWVLLVSLVTGLILQAMALRIGIFTGKHLAQLCREEYSPSTAVMLWLCAEVSIITCDMQAIITSAIAFQILFGLPLWAGCMLTALDVMTFVLLELRKWHSVERFFVFLVAVMATCFFWNVGVNPPNSSDIFIGMVVPELTYSSFAPAVGIVGSIILPQNFFIHSGLVAANPQIDRSKSSKMREANLYMLVDTTGAILVAFLINLAVISSFAEIFYSSDCAGTGNLNACVEGEYDQQGGAAMGTCSNGSGAQGTCEAIGLSDASTALAGALGPTASVVWALGLLASSQSSTMTVAYAGQFVFEGFFEIKLPLYWRVLLCRSVALLPAMFAALASASDPTQLDSITEWGNIVTSVCVPFSIIPMLKFTACGSLMGEGNVMSVHARIFIWTITIFLVFTNVYLVWEHMFLEQHHISVIVFVPVLVFLTLMYLICLYLIGKDDLHGFGQYSFHCLESGDKIHTPKRSKLSHEDPGDDCFHTLSKPVVLTTTEGELASTSTTNNSQRDERFGGQYSDKSI